MSNIAIRVEGLSKHYYIGSVQERYQTFRETLVKVAQSPFRRMASLLRGHAYGAAELHEEIWALKDVSFEVKPGEVVGVIGRNGAGKSTLLKILSRITEPTRGYAEIHGRVGSLLEVGTGFHPELTGRENVYMNGSILGMRRKEIDRKFDEMVAFAEIEKFIDTPVKHYSSGMQVRLAFAVAAHLEPEILIVDEVLAVGDASFQKKCMGKMGEVTNEGRTVLFVSHNMAAVSNLCQRAILLQSGTVVADDTVQKVINEYQQTLDNSQKSFVDLTNWKKRRGPGEVARFAAVALSTLQGKPCEAVATGEGMIIRLQVNFLKPARAPEIGVAVINMVGQRLTHIVSHWENFICAMDTGVHTYEITIPQLPFVPGFYSLVVWVRRQAPGPVDDLIEGAVNFEITQDVNSTVLRNFDTYCQPGEIYIPSHWNVGSS